MAVQLRSILEKDFRVKFAVADLWKYASLKAFSIYMDVLVTNELSSLQGESLAMQSTRKDILTLKELPNARMRLVCFHDAGGSSQLFDDWDKLLAPDFEVVCIQMPGRGDRIDEKPYSIFDAFIQDYLPAIREMVTGKPFALFGHSMGGLLAFEVARRLQQQYNLVASSLIVTGTPCLNGYVNTFINSVIEAKMTDEQLVKLLPSASRIDLTNTIHQRLIQTLRADFELIHSYKYTNFTELASDVIAVTADADDRVKFEDVQKWVTETSGNFKLEVRKGGHNFVYNDKSFLCALIREHCLQIQKEKVV
jgi:medium-chain acyl-[acyl-carrier-protein] hydrolase